MNSDFPGMIHINKFSERCQASYPARILIKLERLAMVHATQRRLVSVLSHRCQPDFEHKDPDAMLSSTVVGLNYVLPDTISCRFQQLIQILILYLSFEALKTARIRRHHAIPHVRLHILRLRWRIFCLLWS